MKKGIAVLLSAIMACGMLAGCGSDSPKAEASGAKTTESDGSAKTEDAYKIGFITLADSDVFCKYASDKFVEYMKEKYPKCEVVTADGNADPAMQIQASENFIAQKCDAICIQAADADASVPAIEAANNAGIPVVTVINTANGGKSTYVGSDNREAGKLQAEYIMKNCKPGVKILYLKGTEGLTHTKLRYEGFFNTLDEAKFEYTLLAEQDGDYLRTKGMDITEDWLQSYSEFDAIVSANDQMALGAIEALKGANIQGTIVVGVDATDDALAAIKAGEMGCSIKQNGLKDAQEAAEAAIKLIKGETVEDVIVPFEPITKENVDEAMNTKK